MCTFSRCAKFLKLKNEQLNDKRKELKVKYDAYRRFYDYQPISAETREIYLSRLAEKHKVEK